MTIRAEVYDTFEGCESEINRLNDSAGNDNPFLATDWLKLWWVHFKQGKSLYILLFRDENRTVGFAPFYRKYRPALGLFDCRLLGEGFSSYLDLVCLPGYEETVVEALFSHFKLMSPGAIVHFHDVNDRFSRFFGPLSKQLAETSWKSSRFKLYPCPLVVLGNNWDEFYKKRKDGKSRSQLKKRVQLLGKVGEVKLREITDETELVRLLPQIEKIYRERFKETENRLYKGEQDIFLKSMLSKMIRSSVSLSILTLDDTPISFIIGFKMGKTFIYFAPGFDPAFNSLSLGHIHLMQIMTKIIDEGFEYFDFSKGEGDYKRRWANDETTSYLFRFGFNLNKVGSCYHRLVDAFTDILVQSREKGYNNKIKHWIARLRQGIFFGREDKPMECEELADLQGLDPINLPGWSYQQICPLPVGVRSSIIKYGTKVDLSQIRLEVKPERRVVTLVSQDGTQGCRVRY